MILPKIFFNEAFKVWAAGLVILCMLSSAPASWGDAREAYKQGSEALDAGRWAAAERFFRAAIEERGEERMNPLLGRRYFPHYYLGVALAKQMRCSEAEKSWAESQRQGKVQKADGLLAELDPYRQACRNHEQLIKKAQDNAEQTLSRVQQTLTTVEQLQGQKALAQLWATDPRDFAGRQQKAVEDLKAARRLYDEGRRQGNTETLRSAQNRGERIQSALQTLIDEARTTLGDRKAATANALESMEETQAAARRVLSSIADLKPFPPRMNRRVQALERLLQEIDERKGAAQELQLKDLGSQLEEATTELRNTTRRPSGRLTEAVTAYLNGDHQSVVELLTDDFRDSRSRGHSCLLQAASRHALWVLDGREDVDLEFQLKENVVRCSELRNLPEMNPKIFSPGFLAFYEQTLKPPEETDGDEMMLGGVQDTGTPGEGLGSSTSLRQDGGGAEAVVDTSVPDANEEPVSETDLLNPKNNR